MGVTGQDKQIVNFIILAKLDLILLIMTKLIQLAFDHH